MTAANGAIAQTGHSGFGPLAGGNAPIVVVPSGGHATRKRSLIGSCWPLADPVRFMTAEDPTRNYWNNRISGFAYGSVNLAIASA